MEGWSIKMAIKSEGGLKTLGIYDRDTLLIKLDPLSKCELNPRLQGLGSHPRDYQIKKTLANFNRKGK